MKWQSWLLAGAVVLAPMAARANVPLDAAHARLGEGTQLIVQGRWADAEKQLREALRLDPTLAEGHYNLGVALRHQGRDDEAIAELHASLAGFTREEDRAKALYAIGLTKEARHDAGAWDEYLAFARPLAAEQPAVRVAQQHRDELIGVKIPGTQKATR